MESDKIIESLNHKLKKNCAEPADWDESDLSSAEKIFLTTYSPQKKLVVYGTLAPGGVNHSVIEHIRGRWQKGIVKGKLLKQGWGAGLGYYGFKPVDKDEEKIPAFILTSDDLAANWQLLDDFEGSEYRRIIAKYQLEDGEIGVGFIYAINDESGQFI